jgi:hypothetical protein
VLRFRTDGNCSSEKRVGRILHPEHPKVKRNLDLFPKRNRTGQKVRGWEGLFVLNQRTGSRLCCMCVNPSETVKSPDRRVGAFFCVEVFRWTVGLIAAAAPILSAPPRSFSAAISRRVSYRGRCVHRKTRYSNSTFQTRAPSQVGAAVVSTVALLQLARPRVACNNAKISGTLEGNRKAARRNEAAVLNQDG